MLYILLLHAVVVVALGHGIPSLSFLSLSLSPSRAMKPENVLIDANGYAVLVDFVYAKKIRDTERSFTLCGTPEYIAPEMVQCPLPKYDKR